VEALGDVDVLHERDVGFVVAGTPESIRPASPWEPKTGTLVVNALEFAAPVTTEAGLSRVQCGRRDRARRLGQEAPDGHGCAGPRVVHSGTNTV